MAYYVDLDKVLEIIDRKQRDLFPVGKFGRSYIYGSDREKYDNWQEIADEIEAIEGIEMEDKDD